MGVIFQILGIAFIVTVANMILKNLKADDYCLLVSLIGLFLGLMLIAPEIKDFIENLKTLFEF